jgi:hypothetical protein
MSTPAEEAGVSRKLGLAMQQLRGEERAMLQMRVAACGGYAVMIWHTTLEAAMARYIELSDETRSQACISVYNDQTSQWVDLTCCSQKSSGG